MIFAFFYVGFGTLITLFQEQIVYYPNAQDFYSCAALSEAETVIQGKTRMYVHKTEKPTVVLYHGNAGSACDRAFYANLFDQANYGYIIVEYTGYSKDTVVPSHQAVKQNVIDVISYIKENNIEFVVVGESIGTGAASYHAELFPPDKLILISPFNDLYSIAKKQFWFYPTKLLVDNAFDNVRSLSEYQNPLLIIHGDADNIIPYQLGEKLHESVKAKKELVTIEGAGHNNLFHYEETYSAIYSFLVSK